MRHSEVELTPSTVIKELGYHYRNRSPHFKETNMQPRPFHLLSILLCVGPTIAAGDAVCSRTSFSADNWDIEDRMNTRHQILQRRSLTNAELSDNGTSIMVVRGSWIDEITGLEYSDVDPSRLLEIDHLIPLQWACEYGAATWTEAQRNDFYNDEVCLLVTTSRENGRKSDLGADVFLPSDDELACEYIDQFQECLTRYPFQITDAVRNGLASHDKAECR